METVWIVSYAALWLIVGFLAFLLLGALRALALTNWRIDNLEAITPSRVGRSGLKLGKTAPDFCLPGVQEENIALERYRGKRVLLVLMQPGCGPCNAIVTNLNGLHQEAAVQVVAVQNGSLEDVRKWAMALGARFPIAVQEKHQISKKYEMFATPYAFLLDERGVVVSKGIVHDATQLRFVLAGNRAQDDPGEKQAGALRQHLVRDHDLSAESIENLSRSDLATKHDEVHLNTP